MQRFMKWLHPKLENVRAYTSDEDPQEMCYTSESLSWLAGVLQRFEAAVCKCAQQIARQEGRRRIRKRDLEDALRVIVESAPTFIDE